MNRIIKATIIISIIRLFDMITTYLNINKFGILVEENPIIKFQIGLFDNLILGLSLHYIWSIILTLLIFVLIDYLDVNKENKKDKNPNLFKRAFFALAAIFSLIPIWNLINLIFG